MDKTTKTVLIIAGSLLLLCVCTVSALLVTGLWSFRNVVRWADNSTSENPQEVIKIGSEIADFDMPEGFGSPYAFHFGEIVSVGYASPSGKTHILLSQIPPDSKITVDEMLRLINSSGDPNGNWYQPETVLIEEKPVTIRGQETTLSIHEGTSSEGVTYRTATVSFQGNSGPSVVMIGGPLDEWDMEMVEEFISSIR